MTIRARIHCTCSAHFHTVTITDLSDDGEIVSFQHDNGQPGNCRKGDVAAAWLEGSEHSLHTFPEITNNPPAVPVP